MKMDEFIKDNTIIISNNHIKKEILLYLNTIPNLYSISFMSFNEIEKHLFFDYSKKTIYYLMKKGMPYEVALTLIKNMYYIDDKKYNNKKLDELVTYKKELEDNKLLIKDEIFVNYIKNKNIIVLDKYLTKYQKYIIDILRKYTNVTIYEYESNNYSHDICEFKTIDNEVEYVAYSICELINKGVDINNIKLANIDDDYINVIKRIFGYFNIPINLSSKSYIIGTKIAKEILSNFNSDISITIDSISSYKGNPIYDLIIDIINKYTFIDDYNEVYDMIVHDLSTTLVPKRKYKNAIEVIDYNEMSNTDYIFLMNFNLKSIPRVYKDEDYLTDNIKPEYLDNTKDKNIREKELVKDVISNVKNLVITYKLITPTSEFYPSSLVEKEVVKPTIDIYNSYSSLNDKLKLSSSIDKLIKYGVKDGYLNALLYNYKLDKKYDNKYHKVDLDKLHKFMNNELYLSYTSMEKYNECPFRYYIENVLKLNVYEENFAAIFGDIFHHILELGCTKEIDIDSELASYIKEKYSDRVFSKKETFFIENAKQNMRVILDVIARQMQKCKLDVIKTEIPVSIDESRDGIKITFTGKIDKLLYKEYADKTIVAIIDYKTGNSVDINLAYKNEGIGLQLPIYLLLAKELKLKDIKYAGIYLQKVMPNIDNLDEVKSIDDKLKLEGYSNSDDEIIGELDITYTDSSVIKGLKKTASGEFRKNSKVMSNLEFEELVKLTNDEIEKCITNILNGEFDITPVKEEGKDDIKACQYCKYKDICFMTNKDIRIIKKDTGDLNE